MPSTNTYLNTKDPTHWNLVEAVTLVAELQPEVYAAGYYIVLAGGVIVNGFSSNDLDLIVMRRLYVNQHEKEFQQVFEDRSWVVLNKYEKPQKRWKIGRNNKLIDLTFGIWI